MTNTMAMAAYSSTADQMVERILATFREHPEAAAIDDPWQLFKVPGFDCADLNPSLFQASWALAEARRRYAAR